MNATHPFRHLRVRILLTTLLTLGSPAASAGPPPCLEWLDPLPGQLFSNATAVAEDGTVVVGTSGKQAFRWSVATGAVGLGDLPGGQTESFGLAVSADGSAVVGLSSDSFTTDQAFLWTVSEGMIGLGDLSGGPADSAAHGVSRQGSVVVGRSYASDLDPNATEAFLWTSAGGMMSLGDLPGGRTSSAANAITPDGLVVVGYGRSASGAEAMRWTAEAGMVGLGDLPQGAYDSFASDVSDDGLVVVGRAWGSEGREAFRWTSETGIVGLGDLADDGNTPDIFWSSAAAVDASGHRVVGRSLVGSCCQGKAFVWDAVNGMRSVEEVLTAHGIDVSAWQLHDATGISADGNTLVGTGLGPSGGNTAWVARLCACRGDTDFDFDVDLGDLATVLASYGTQVGEAGYYPTADQDADNTIGLADLAVVLSAFGMPCSCA